MAQRRKRSNSDVDDHIPSSPAHILPPSSPPAFFEDEDDESGEIRDDIIDDLEEAAEEADGEDLFNDDMMR